MNVCLLTVSYWSLISQCRCLMYIFWLKYLKKKICLYINGEVLYWQERIKTLFTYSGILHMCVSRSVVSGSLWPHGLSPGFSVDGILQTRILERVAILFSGDRPDPRVKPWSPALQVDSLPYEPPGSHYSAIKRNKTVPCRDLDGPRDCHTEWSKSEREKHHMLLHIYEI